MRPGREASLDQAGALLRAGHAWAGLAGDALAFVLSREARRGRWLVVLDGDDRAEQLVRALRFLHPNPDQVESFPADDHRPYDGFSPDPARPRRRLATLERVDRGGDLIVITTGRALLQRVPDADTRQRSTKVLETGAPCDREALVRHLTEAGYLSTARVTEPGQFAARGDVVDVWGPGARTPTRVDLFDDEIESLRRFDPATQRPGKTGRRVTLLAAREERVDEAAIERALRELGRLVALDGGSDGAVRRRAVVDEWRSGVRLSGLEEWLPALVPTVEPLAALAGLRPIVVLPDDVHAALRDFEATVHRRYEGLTPEERPLVPPGERYVAASVVLEALSGAHEVMELPSDRAPDLGARSTEELAVRGSELGPTVARIQALLDADARVVLVAEDLGRGERLTEMLEPHGLHPVPIDAVDAAEPGKLALQIGDLPRGFVAASSGWAIVPVRSLFGAPRRGPAERAHDLWQSAVTSTAQLRVDDAVVHRSHGVGLYRGLLRLEIKAGVEQDFVKLEYRDGDLMFLPVAALAQLSRYAPTQAGATPTLDKLGGLTWARRKGKVRDSLFAMAQDLLRLYARRELAERDPCPPPGRRYRAFEARFPYTETVDQAAAIEAVMADLSRPWPMDRLVCGDVGFGKTEVAMRAAMRVVEAGRQVLVLCPTTVLAHQHLRSFRDRFAVDPDVRVGMLSRFTPAEDVPRLLEELANGDVQIVVGTTALLGRDVRFADLGLAVVDEEHRFGVKQKDRLKRLRTQIDLLALSATPIPRTLQLALSGAREMSIIATPPRDRLSVRTSIARFSEARVRDTITTEVERGGQVYFVHNRVETIDRVADDLRGWVPDVRVAVAHGQMEDALLERVLVDFVEGQSDVLVCSAIVESGVDLPNVNAMIVNRADRFGLAQLYQLRGRVGRGDRRATCLLLTPEDIALDARKRLRVVLENQSLGAGFQIASADLELRGGGNVLGAAQSGNIDQVGYDTWVELLGEAVHRARGDVDREQIEPEVEVPVPAFLPDALIQDPDERLAWYQKLGYAQTPGEVDRRLDELEGEFGTLDEQARNLGDLIATRLMCRDLGIVRCTWMKVRLTLELHPSSLLHGKRLQDVVTRHPKRFEMGGSAPVVVTVRFTPQEGERPFRYLRWVFAQLGRAEA